MSGRLLHVLGGGAWQLPTIRLAKRLGYRVLVSDMYDERPGYALADAHEVVDITDVDGTLDVARGHGIDGIVCDTTDVGVPTMAAVAEALGLPGIGSDAALAFTNKHVMRSRTAARGLANPPFALVPSVDAAHDLAEGLGYPCVFKSVDSQSSRGVTIAKCASDVEGAYAAARAASRSDVIVEGFLRGQELTVEGYCVDGEPVVGCVSDKSHYGDLPVAHRLTYPAAISPAQRAAVEELNRGVVQALGLVTGVTHGEYMLDGDDVALVEIAARGGGNHVYSDILPALANRAVPASYLGFVMGEGWAEGPALRADGPGAANLAFFRFPPGVVDAVNGLERARALPGVEAVVVELDVDRAVPPVADDRSRHGFMLVFGATRDDVLARTREVYDMVSVTIGGVDHGGAP